MDNFNACDVLFWYGDWTTSDAKETLELGGGVCNDLARQEAREARYEFSASGLKDTLW